MFPYHSRRSTRCQRRVVALGQSSTRSQMDKQMQYILRRNKLLCPSREHTPDLHTRSRKRRSSEHAQRGKRMLCMSEHSTHPCHFQVYTTPQHRRFRPHLPSTCGHLGKLTRHTHHKPVRCRAWYQATWGTRHHHDQRPSAPCKFSNASLHRSLWNISPILTKCPHNALRMGLCCKLSSSETLDMHHHHGQIQL
jgi:hypothetical protein